MRYSFLSALLVFSGCVTTKTAVKHGQRMYDLGYAMAMTENALQRLNMELKNSYLEAQVAKMSSEAEERERRSAPYVGMEVLQR